MLGYTSEEWLSTPDFCIQHVHEEDRERVVRETKAILSGTEQAIISFRWRAKDGGTVWVKAQLAAILDERGKLIGSRGVTINMTEQQLAATAHLVVLDDGVVGELGQLGFRSAVERTRLEVDQTHEFHRILLVAMQLIAPLRRKSTPISSAPSIFPRRID